MGNHSKCLALGLDVMGVMGRWLDRLLMGEPAATLTSDPAYPEILYPGLFSPGDVIS